MDSHKLTQNIELNEFVFGDISGCPYPESTTVFEWYIGNWSPMCTSEEEFRLQLDERFIKKQQ